MASKRKSTIPCMIPKKLMSVQEGQGAKAKTLPVLAEDKGVISAVQETNERGRDLKEGSKISSPEGVKIQNEGDAYGCQPCHFKTRDLNIFLDHVYSCHPDFRAEPSFHCLDCGVATRKFEGLALHNARAHPSSAATTLQLRKRDWKLTVEQKLVNGGGSAESEISISKTPIMKTLRGKGEHKRIVVSHVTDEPSPAAGNEAEGKDPSVAPPSATTMNSNAAGRAALPSTVPIVNGSPALSVLKVPVAQVLQNCTFLQQSVPTEVPTLQSSSFTHSSSSTSDSKNLPKVMIPLSSIPTYAAAMDTSSFLKTSFSKFPYPTKAELCYLTVVTNYPEEQIKIWFTAQRLKQGISWSPEEIEESRRKMFNTIIQEPNSQPIATHQQLQPHHRPTHRSHRPAQVAVTIRPSAAGTTGTTHILKDNFGGKGGFIASQPMTSNGIQVGGGPVALAVTPKPHTGAVPQMQARPAAALVADKGATMMVGVVGSSSSSYISNSINRTSTVISTTISSGFSSNISSNSGFSSGGSANSSSGGLNGSAGSSSCGFTSSSSAISSGSGFSGNTSSSSSGFTSSGSASSSSSNLSRNASSSISMPTVVNSNSSTNTSKSDSTSKGNIFRSATNGGDGKVVDPSPPVVSSGASSRTLPNSFLDPSFYKSKKSQEQLGALKQSFFRSQFPEQEEVERLTRITGLTVREVRKWFSDRRYHNRNLKGLRASGILGKGPALDFVDSPTSAESPKASQSSPSPPPALSPQNRLTSQQESDDCLIEPHEKDTLERKMEGGDFDKEVDVSNNGKDTSTKEEEGCEGQVPSPGTSWQQCFKEDCEEEEDPMSNLPDPKPKINPIKINLKRLKVTEACSKQGLEDSQQDMDSQSPKTSSLSVSTCTPTRGKKTPEQMHLLKQVFARTQWPSSEQYDQLVVLTGLPRPEVVRWFGDSRYVFKNGQLKWLESYQNTIEMEVEEEKLKMAKSEDARAQDQPLALPSRLEVRGLAGSQKEHILHGSSATPLLPNGDKETETQKDQAIATEGLPPPNDEAALETKGQSTLNKPREAPSGAE
ncbi:zinc fingers and homeoboxes protein 3-like [Scleropages formosus]|uniref:Zinc fingers and homeoboxes 3 n=1 Tax=Scleropages formosus TaxID=113540 RepID=A0A8C9SIY2_SCLFO|nr:zinc fingers and homeoboxes protein 3-like [Scleropages formosus]XP_029108170.1 zinc fingers and homeoboxes protein 3-like [Scleropages formosus]